jgi:hypothetical protein
VRAGDGGGGHPPRQSEIGEQPRDALIKHGAIVPAGLVAERRGEPALGQRLANQAQPTRRPCGKFDTASDLISPPLSNWSTLALALSTSISGTPFATTGPWSMSYLRGFFQHCSRSASLGAVTGSAFMAAYRRFLGEVLLTLPGVRETRTYAVMEEVKADGMLPL